MKKTYKVGDVFVVITMILIIFLGLWCVFMAPKRNVEKRKVIDSSKYEIRMLEGDVRSLKVYAGTLERIVKEQAAELEELKSQPRHIREGWEKIVVRLTHYSVEEEGESSINHRGKKINNENGVATRNFPDGTEFYIPKIGYKVRDDNIPLESVRILLEAMWSEGRKTLPIVDVRWLGKSSRECRALERKHGRYLYVWVSKDTPNKRR